MEEITVTDTFTVAEAFLANCLAVVRLHDEAYIDQDTAHRMVFNAATSIADALAASTPPKAAA